jgi:hypothetical protein
MFSPSPKQSIMSLIPSRLASFFALLLLAGNSPAAPPYMPLAPHAALSRFEAGCILYTRHEAAASPVAGVQPVFVPKIFSMTPDSRSAEPAWGK